jgi:hypothetical protein
MMMTLSRRWVCGAVWVVLLITGSFLARAQEVLGNISGTVVDPAGAGVNGAVVTVMDTDRMHLERTVKTGKTGFYMADSLPLGHYSVTIAMKGFKTASVTGIYLKAHDELKFDQKLVAGGATDTVTTVANPMPLSVKNGMVEGVVSDTQVHDLILNTRDYAQLVTLQPGVSSNAGDQLYIGGSVPAGMSNQVLFSINGQRSSSNDWTVDGADNVNRGGNPNLPGGDGGTTLLTLPSIDAISEVVTLRSGYEAEYGRNLGGQIDAITKSGTKSLHGSAFEFFRNDILNANNFFTNLTGTPRPPLRYNDFGFTLGGPVVIPHLYHGKDRTFFFYSQEFRRVVSYGTTTSYVPTQQERLGNFPGVAVCQYGQASVINGSCSVSTTPYQTGQLAQFSPTSLAYVNDIYGTGATPNIPYPNSTADLAAGLDPHLLSTNVRNTYNDAQELARIDQTIGAKMNVFYRYLHDSLPTTEANGLFSSGGALPGVQTTSTTSPGTSHIGHITIAAHPTMLIDFGYAYSSGSVFSTPTGLASTKVNNKNTTAISSTTLPYTSGMGVIPSLAFTATGGPGETGPVPTGISSAGNYFSYNKNHNGFGSLSYIYREHSLKFGVTYNHYQKQENATGIGRPYPQGLFTIGNETLPTAAQLTSLGAGVGLPNNFDSTWASFLIGDAANGTAPGFQQGSTDNNANLNESMLEFYVQDSWRATRRLTLNLGVRYSYFGQPYDNNHELTNFSPSSFNTLNAQTIDSNGQLCTTAGQSTFPNPSTSSSASTVNGCLNTNGLNTITPNSIADPLNGILLGTTIPYLPFNEASGAPSPSIHGSPYGLQVGHAEKRDWAPRVGFALDVHGDGKMVVRGGYGIAYDDAPVSIYEQSVFNNIPYVVVASYGAASTSNPGGNFPLANLTPPTLYSTPVIYQTPYAQQFSIGIQQAITPTMILDVGYVGAHGDHLLGRVDINEVPQGLFQADSIANNGSGFRTVNLTGTAVTGTSTGSCTPTSPVTCGPPGLSTFYGGSNVGDLACTNASSCAYNVFNPPTNCGSGFITALCENPLNQIRPYPGYGPINAVKSSFNSNYNSLQAKFTKKFSGRSLLDANYTWSKGLTNAPDQFSGAQNSYNIEPEYGRSSLDRSNVLTIDGIWDLPWYRDQKGLVGHIVGGWEMSGIYTAYTGMPLTATLTDPASHSGAGGVIDYNGNSSIYNPLLKNGGVLNDSAGLGVLGTSAATLRPTQVLDPNSGYGLQTLHKRLSWFNQTAFVAPSAASFTVGNERRATIQGPGYNRLDIGLFRSFRLYRESNLQLRGEAFNVLNHPNWSTVCTVATDAGCTGGTFGQVTAAHDARILQLGGKVSF